MRISFDTNLINSYSKFSDGKEVNYTFVLVNGNYPGAKTVQHSGAFGGCRPQLVRFSDQIFSVKILSTLASFDQSSLVYKVADIYLDEHLKPAVSQKETSYKRNQNEI